MGEGLQNFNDYNYDDYYDDDDDDDDDDGDDDDDDDDDDNIDGGSDYGVGTCREEPLLLIRFLLNTKSPSSSQPSPLLPTTLLPTTPFTYQ